MACKVLKADRIFKYFEKFVVILWVIYMGVVFFRKFAESKLGEVEKRKNALVSEHYASQ